MPKVFSLKKQQNFASIERKRENFSNTAGDSSWGRRENFSKKADILFTGRKKSLQFFFLMVK
jgi:hypothetical protein